ncbi:hypothetical protein BS78_02G200100 [Paspalum vaginatum]|nr:hypothetical protein BS78_02G200100 [Paspalum vaginatum]KAJ1289896.1 hypothetical protein BS78_02G200100 [Paspalum vaginatum]KAJ1289897.1 hypothetical protein BS78_02G200100 [Paspalum vaginatum]KAJ1289898.1 hypothetical protein BS78_02G200100 [Paspalum vaginatum]KAJ1289899.1 hypothetical protein BS78_02G200100 [Paspalum vaginatum]
MAAPPAGGLVPLAGWSPFPWCSSAPLCCRSSPSPFKVAISNPQPGSHGFAPAVSRKCAAVSDHGRQELRASEYQFDDDEPLWLAVVRDLAVDLKGLLAFLAEQPRQLKHLEWPGFRNTLKTATLTLILVAVFIVALSTVDAALCFVLAWLLRKST